MLFYECCPQEGSFLLRKSMDTKSQRVGRVPAHMRKNSMRPGFRMLSWRALGA